MKSKRKIFVADHKPRRGHVYGFVRDRALERRCRNMTPEECRAYMDRIGATRNKNRT